MKLEQQVTSLGVSQKLKELGVKQESVYAWVNQKEKVGSYLDSIELYATMGRTPTNGAVSAFTCAELGEMLPDTFITQKAGNNQWTCYGSSAWWAEQNDERFENEVDTVEQKDTIADTEADARGLMAIYLAENGLIIIK